MAIIKCIGSSKLSTDYIMSYVIYLIFFVLKAEDKEFDCTS